MNGDFLTEEAMVFVLEIMRTGGMIVAAPILFSSAPARVKGAIAIVLALVSHGTALRSPVGVDSFEHVAAAIPCEFLIGLAMGMVVRFVLSIAEIMGDSVSPLLGIGSASLFDPHTQTEETSFTRLFRLFAVLLALVLGVHRILIAALIQSFRVIPVGALANPSLAAPDLVGISAASAAAGLRLALPVVAVLLLVQLALAFLSRAAPSLQIFSIGFGASLISGMLVVFISLPELGHEFERELSRTGERIESVLSRMTAE